MSRFPGGPASRPPVATLDAQELALVHAAVVDRYVDVRCVARGLNAASRKGRRGIIERFLRFSACPIWRILPHHYDRFIATAILERGLAGSTHRYYQSTIDGFFTYIVADTEVQNDFFARYGARVSNPITDENRVIHKAELEHKRPHYSLTREEITAFFAAIGRLRDLATLQRNIRRALSIERDRVAFATQYYIALRVSECCGLDVDSFEEAPWARQLMGPFGQVRVVGKGLPQQGPKPRIVPVTTVALRPLLEWYLQKVRPQFPNARKTRALFLNQRGGRLSRSHLIHAIKPYLETAGLDPARFTTHSLRRSGITHDVERMDMAFGQMKAGHEWQATTQIYIARPDEYVQEQANRLVRQTVMRQRPRDDK